MRWIVFLTIALTATTVMAENLLINPDFDLDPTVPGNGWSAIGTGAFTWGQTIGDPAAPSARTDQNDDESMILFQCVTITGGTILDFSARSFTHSSIGLAENSVSVSVFPTADCSGIPIETVFTDQQSAPNWILRERSGYVTPVNALGARITLFSAANGTNNYISWDNVWLGPDSSPTVSRTWGSIKTLFR